jgi:hypothetical protein
MVTNSPPLAETDVLPAALELFRLIYGLTQVDKFVVDEAHLFYGLILQNLS